MKNRLKSVIVMVLSFMTGSGGLQAQGPSGGVVRAGDARITGQGTATTRIDQASERAIVDWRSFGIGTGDQVIFQQPSARSATLNRVTGDQASAILGRLDANGTVFLLINPNGIVFGGGAQIHVGSLIASTSNISDSNFMSGTLAFDQPGRLGAGIFNAGALSARDGGLVALVAPHVRNDGVIVARLGKVVLGSADTFTVDLYGDALINLALSDGHAGQLIGLNGEPVTSLITNHGQIETMGGQTVLMTARNAKHVLDSLINMTGTIKADSAIQQGGRIVLLGEGGHVDVSGALSAQGSTGGSIEVLGDSVRLSSSSSLDASGLAGGGTVRAGGAYQGGGDTYRSSLTTVESGATLRANASEHGNGGEVVVWSDGFTQFGGLVEARGADRGAGGVMEVSGKRTLNFFGQANASAKSGRSGSLLLDPETLSIGATEAGAIMRVLRTGTATTVQADVDINVDSPILGGDRASGAGLTMTAGRNINVNDFIVTHNGAINLNAAQGTVSVAPGKAVFAGTAPITVTANGDLRTGSMMTSGALSIESLTGGVAIDAFIDEHTGPVSIRAAGRVDINQPIVSMASGNALTVTAGSDINVNAQVDGRGDIEGASVTMTASNNVNVNEAIITNNASLSLTATNGTMSVAGAPLVSGSGALALSARGNIATGPMSAGSLAVNSSAGSVRTGGVIDAATGAARISAASDVTIGDVILNGRSGGSLTITAGRDIAADAMIDGRGGVAGGAVVINAGRNLTLGDYLLTNNAAITLTAANGTLNAGKGTFAGDAGIAMRSGGDLTTGVISGGSLTANSTGGSVRVNGVIDGGTGRVDLVAAADVAVNAAVLNGRSGASFNATAGRDLVINAPIDGRTGATRGAVALRAARDVAINGYVVTNDGQIDVTAGGAARMSAGTALVSGNAGIALTAGGDLTTQGISGRSLSATSTGGSVSVDGVIDGNTGRVDLSARRDININAPVLNPRTGASLNATAGGNINVNAQIDGTNGASGGTVNLTASGDLNVNAPIATRDGEIRLSATNGTATVVPAAGLYAGAGSISLSALGNVITSTVIGGPMNIASGAGSVFVSGPIFGTGGAMTIGAAGQVTMANAITNFGVSPLNITAGSDITVNAPIGRSSAGVPSGPVTLSAGQNVQLNDSIVTQDGAISVATRTGAVTAAAGQGLFAGSGAVTMQSAQTLTTPVIGTTGAVTLRSTAGGVNLETALNGGAVTIEAATDVNLNRGISNSRSDAPVSVTAGRSINVNAAIDGRGGASPSGTVTLNAGGGVALNQSIVTNDASVSVTARNGAVTVAADQGLHSGAGGIALTSSATLDTPLMSTTGALSLTSTAGSVNVSRTIGDTTGTVTISAANAVNVNQAITNLKSGAGLSITAGTDINVSAPIDGRNGAAAGGTVTMTAGNNINVTSAIATNNGAIALTATNGAVTLPTATEVVQSVFDVPANQFYNQITTPMQASVLAGNAAVSITSGSNFTLTSPVKTTGALTIKSTNGNLTTSAPIDNQTGTVSLTAGNRLIVNREIKSNDKAITLTAGAGGILINQIDDKDYTDTASVNARNADLTLNSTGDVTILDDQGVGTTQTLTIDTRGQIVSGKIGDATTAPGRPQTVVLTADNGIASFNTGNVVGTVTAKSSTGSITLQVDNPGKLRVTTGTAGTTDCPACDIAVTAPVASQSIGPDVILNAGGSINMAKFRSTTADFTARSGDITFGDEAYASNSLTANAGRDIKLNNRLWIGPQPGTAAGGPLSLTAGRDIVAIATAPVHVSNSQLATLIANRNLTLFTFETLGGVSLTATTGNITLNTDIGGNVVNGTSFPAFNPGSLGVASFTLSAPAATAAVSVQGVRSQGNVTISTGGTLTASKQITSTSGSVSIFAAGGATLSALPIGNVAQVDYATINTPVSPRGPAAPVTGTAATSSNGGPGLPSLLANTVVGRNQTVNGVNTPGANGRVDLGATAIGPAVPQGIGRTVARPGVLFGVNVTPPDGNVSDQRRIDPASALRTVGEKCDQESGSAAGTGLDAALPKTDATDATGQISASCAAAAPTKPGGV